MEKISVVFYSLDMGQENKVFEPLFTDHELKADVCGDLLIIREKKKNPESSKEMIGTTRAMFNEWAYWEKIE